MATKKPTAKQLAARAKFAAMAKSGALARKRKAAAKPKAKKNPAPRAKNPVTVARATKTRKSLVGGIYYAVLFYQNKSKPEGKPTFVIPARDRKHAMGFVKALTDQGASGVALIEKTVATV